MQFLPRPPYSRVKRYSDVYKHPRKQLCAQKVPEHASFTIWRRKHRSSLNHMSHWHQVRKVPNDMINFDSHSFRFATYITYPQQVLSFAFAFVPKRFLVGLHLKVKGTMVIFEGIFIDQDFKKRLLLRSGLTLHGWRGLRKEARTKCHAVSGVLL